MPSALQIVATLERNSIKMEEEKKEEEEAVMSSNDDELGVKG